MGRHPKNKTGISAHGKNAVIVPKNLGELRTRFDGFRDVAAKLPEGPIKVELLTGVEEMYLSTANWFTGITASGYEPTV